MKILREIKVGGGVDSSLLADLRKTDYMHPQGDLFPEIPTLDPKLPKTMEIVGKIGSFRVIDHHEPNLDPNEKTFVVFDRNIPAGWLSYGMPKPGYALDLDGEGRQVHSIYIGNEYAGKGLATAFYTWILTNCCDYLVADELQTYGGVALWRKLLNSNRFDVMVYDHRTSDSRKRWAGKDFNQVYNTNELIPWVTLRGNAVRLIMN